MIDPQITLFYKMNRLQLLENQLSNKGPKAVTDSYEFYQLHDLLSPEENKLRLEVRAFVEKEMAPTINEYVDTATFPYALVQKMKSINLLDHFFKAPYGNEKSTLMKGLIIAEFARVDAGLATFFAVQWALCGFTIEAMGSEEQKAKYLPRLKNLDILGGWGLTEKDVGSDASNLKTTATKTEGGYILNGNKRWIGNGNQDIVVVWARDSETKKVNAFIVHNNSKGFTSVPIKHKLPLRIVQNCDITLENVFVPEENKLQKAKDFATGTNYILEHSRCFIPWIAVGICQGVYDNVSKYITQRHQFQVPIASFQLQQERLVRIQATTTAVFLSAWRIAKLWDEKKATIGMIAMLKAWASERTREVARLGREMMGGNGIITDNYCIKAVNDAEVVYTYEGTYDINCLVAGRELTGIAAFKVPVSK